MDFNVKKLASDAGVFFTRAVQFTTKFEHTNFPLHFLNTLKNYRKTDEVNIFKPFVCPSNLSFHLGARIEEFFYEKLDKKAPTRTTNGELLGQYMQDAAKDFGPGTPYGEYRITKIDSQMCVLW
uniref:Uncharacterized protein n=1 Tax=Astyanax mexicanus TaxID=7994 RepID=A0A8B9LNW0_ASTMX